MSECQRCGTCCDNIGTIWVHSQHPLIKVVGELVFVNDLFADEGPCLFLTYDSNNQAACLVEKYLGKGAKPDVCRDYPDGEKCFREKAAKVAAMEGDEPGEFVLEKES